MNEVTDHYNLIEEKNRLSSGIGLLEKERTQEIINRYIHKKNAVILDIGGAAGVYSFWLAAAGHQVHLVDASAKHIEQAKQINQHIAAKLQSIAVGDARDLYQFPHESMDIVLLFGPLYHLINREDRLTALKECLRVLKRDGKLFCAGINRYASLYDGLHRGLIDDPEFVKILKQDLADGQHRNPTAHPEYFTTAIFQLPQEMEEEIAMAGFVVEKSLPLEGPLWLVPFFEERWKKLHEKAKLMDIMASIETDTFSLVLTQHYVVVSSKS
jgi:ubiquinone/menaquinone biosynthesis C-methylase UbiE